MISVTGLPTIVALRLVDATETQQHELIRNDTRNARAIEHFYENIGTVENVDDLIADPELFGFVMRAFDLEDQIFGKAMMEQILKSNVEEEDSLVNRMSDPRFRALYDEMGFGTDGEGNINTILGRWQDRMVDRFVDRQFLNDNSEQNDTLGTALDFRRKAEDIETSIDILADRRMSQFFRTVLGIPSQTAGLSIDRQAAMIDERFDIETLQDPEEVEKLIRRYVAISDATSGLAAQNSGAVMLMQGAVAASSGSAGFVPTLIDITAINTSGFSAYKLG